MKMDMQALIAGFPAQLREALEIGRQTAIRPAQTLFNNIVLIGLGGSAFGGEVTTNVISEHCRLPFSIVRDYGLPAYVTDKTLVIASSYSGNTEEIEPLSLKWQHSPPAVQYQKREHQTSEQGYFFCNPPCRGILFEFVR